VHFRAVVTFCHMNRHHDPGWPPARGASCGKAWNLFLNLPDKPLLSLMAIPYPRLTRLAKRVQSWSVEGIYIYNIFGYNCSLYECRRSLEVVASRYAA
jgi:hypothetical protein